MAYQLIKQGDHLRSRRSSPFGDLHLASRSEDSGCECMECCPCDNRGGLFNPDYEGHFDGTKVQLTIEGVTGCSGCYDEYHHDDISFCAPYDKWSRVYDGTDYNGVWCLEIQQNLVTNPFFASFCNWKHVISDVADYTLYQYTTGCTSLNPNPETDGRCDTFVYTPTGVITDVHAFTRVATGSLRWSWNIGLGDFFAYHSDYNFCPFNKWLDNQVTVLECGGFPHPTSELPGTGIGGRAMLRMGCTSGARPVAPRLLTTPAAVPVAKSGTLANYYTGWNGAAAWLELHNRFKHYRDEKSEERWFRGWVNRIPCGNCLRHLFDILPYLWADFSSKRSQFIWSVKLHNAINKNLEKREWSIEEAAKFHQYAD